MDSYVALHPVLQKEVNFGYYVFMIIYVLHY